MYLVLDLMINQVLLYIKDSEDFIKAAKFGDLYEAKVLIMHDRFLVYAFDEVFFLKIEWKNCVALGLYKFPYEDGRIFNYL